MRLLCPHCQKVVAIADGEAGRAVSCPECHKEFQAPSLFVPEVSASFPSLSGTPGGEREKDKPPAAARTEAPASNSGPASSSAADGTRFHGFAISLRECDWILRVCLTLPLFLGLFSWVRSAPLGYTAYSQSAWDAAFHGLSVDKVAEKTFHWESSLREHLHTSWWLFPFGIALTLAALLAWSEAIMNKWKPRLPLAVEKLLEQRERALAGLTVLAFLFLAVQILQGLGLANSAYSIAEENNAAARTAAVTDEEIKTAEIKTGRDLGAYQIENTIWFGLAKLCLVLAVLAVALSFELRRRGNLPLPRIGIWI